jgi:Cysteine-rich CPCC
MVKAATPALENAFLCPCCEAASFSEKGSFEICDVCNWEDDPVQFFNPTLAGGANITSLIEARENFKNYGHCRGPIKTPRLP